MRETEKFPPEMRPPAPVGAKHVATTCSTPPEDINTEQSPKRHKKKKKKRKEEKEGHLPTKNISPPKHVHPCEKKNKTPHIPAPVQIMDDPTNRGTTDGSSQNPGIVQSRTGGRLTHQDRHLNNGRRSEASNTTTAHLGAVTEHLFPFAAVERTAHY